MPPFFHKSSLEVSFAVKVMVSMVSASLTSFIVEGGTDSAMGAVRVWKSVRRLQVVV